MTAILDHAANDGFPEWISGLGEANGVDTSWESAHQYRQRHLLEVLAKTKG